LTKQEDNYRPSYGRRQETYPRQCVFGGTTNRDDFLQDATGNRRFWPIEVHDASRLWAEMTPEVVDQIWAEADMAYKLGEELYLTGEASKVAAENQDTFMEVGGKTGLAGEFLKRKLPANWNAKTVKQRIDWLNGFDFDDTQESTGEFERERISGIELFVECFKGRAEDYKKADAHEMTDILNRLGWKKAAGLCSLGEYGRQRYFTRNGNKEIQS